jgi:hypothetical protein
MSEEERPGLAAGARMRTRRKGSRNAKSGNRRRKLRLVASTSDAVVEAFGDLRGARQAYEAEMICSHERDWQQVRAHERLRALGFEVSRRERPKPQRMKRPPAIVMELGPLSTTAGIAATRIEEALRDRDNGCWRGFIEFDRDAGIELAALLRTADKSITAHLYDENWRRRR